MIDQHQIDVIALQEGPNDEFSIDHFNEKLREGRLAEFTAQQTGSKWLLYRTDRFQNPSAVEGDGASQKITLEIQGTSDSVVFYNAHMRHEDTPERHETYIRDQHQNASHVITVGDFNIGIGGTNDVPFQLTGRVPPTREFTGGAEACDATDGCFSSDSRSRTPTAVAGTVLDPISGKALTATRSFPQQPDCRRYRACINFAMDQSSHQYRAWRGSFRACQIVSAYDIRTGQSVIGFGFNGNQVPEKFSSLQERGLIGECKFNVCTGISGANTLMPFYFMSKTFANFISNTIMVEREIEALPEDLKNSATALKDALFEELCQKLETAKTAGKVFNIYRDYAYQQMMHLGQTLVVINNPKKSNPEKLKALKQYERQAKRSSSGWKKFGKCIASFLIAAVCAVVGAVIGAAAGGALGTVSGPGSLVTAVAGAVAGAKAGAAVGLSAGAAMGLGGSAALFARRTKEERLAKAFVEKAEEKLTTDESVRSAVAFD